MVAMHTLTLETECDCLENGQSKETSFSSRNTSICNNLVVKMHLRKMRGAMLSGPEVVSISPLIPLGNHRRYHNYKTYSSLANNGSFGWI